MRNVVVTGAASGVGKATVKAFLEQGDRVFMTDWKAEPLEAACEEFNKEYPGKAYCKAADVGKWDDVAALAEMVKEQGGADVLANCAGVFRVGQIEDAPEEDYDFQFDVNVRGIFHTMKAFGPQMLAKKKGAIVNVSSVSGMGGDYNMSLYCATKGAGTGNEPGGSDGLLDAGSTGKHDLAECGKDADVFNGSEREGTGEFPDEHAGESAVRAEYCANVIVYLASDQATHLCGVNIPVDGGLSAWNGQPNQEKTDTGV